MNLNLMSNRQIWTSNPLGPQISLYFEHIFNMYYDFAYIFCTQKPIFCWDFDLKKYAFESCEHGDDFSFSRKMIGPREIFLWYQYFFENIWQVISIFYFFWYPLGCSKNFCSAVIGCNFFSNLLISNITAITDCLGLVEKISSWVS